MTSDGSRDEFVVVHRFMIEELGLKGATLLVYARIYGFCETSNLDFYESKPKTAEFLGLSERTVFHSIRELTARGLIYEVGSHELGVGRSTKVYRIARAPSARTKSEAARNTCAKRQSPEPTYDDAHESAPFPLTSRFPFRMMRATEDRRRIWGRFNPRWKEVHPGHYGAICEPYEPGKSEEQ